MFYHWLSTKNGDLPSGKLSHNYGKSMKITGKSTISMAIFYVDMLNYQRVPIKMIFHSKLLVY